MNNDTISRSEIINALDKAGALTDYGKYIIENAPTIEAREQWISVEDRLPKSEQRVNAAVKFKRYDGTYRYCVIEAAHIGHHEITTDDWLDYEGETEYDEEKDCFWILEGWYEDNLMEDNLCYAVDDDYEVTHWMPLPKPPKEKKK